MAMFRCPECDCPVSTHARACPDCGCDFEQYARSRPMHPEDKKWWTIVALAVAALVVFVLASNGPPKDYEEMKNDYEISRLRDAYNRGQ